MLLHCIYMYTLYCFNIKSSPLNWDHFNLGHHNSGVPLHVYFWIHWWHLGAIEDTYTHIWCCWQAWLFWSWTPRPGQLAHQTSHRTWPGERIITCTVKQQTPVYSRIRWFRISEEQSEPRHDLGTVSVKNVTPVVSLNMPKVSGHKSHW